MYTNLYCSLRIRVKIFIYSYNLKIILNYFYMKWK